MKNDNPNISLPSTITLKDKLEAFDMNLLVAGDIERPITAATYTTGYMLDASQQNFAIAYEIARRQGKSFNEVLNQYHLESVPLSSIPGSAKKQQDEAIDFAFKNTTAEEPTIIMVNYRIGEGSRSAHWAPVVVSKDQQGNFTITGINSSTEPSYKREITEFQQRLADELKLKSNITTSVKIIDASRDVQTGNICGLASADASAIAIQAIANKTDVKDAILAAPDQQKKLEPTAREETYLAQGQRTFALIEYMTALPEKEKQVAMELPIVKLEKEALIKAGLLSEQQVLAIKTSEQIDQVLVLKTNMDKELQKSGLKFDKDQQVKLYDEIISNSFKNNTFNADSAKQHLTDHIYALKLQSEELAKVGIKAKSIEKIQQNMKQFLSKYEPKKGGHKEKLQEREELAQKSKNEKER